MSHPKGASNQLFRDRRVNELYEKLVEIEERLIPTGLHVFGEPSNAGQRIDMLRMVASFDRPELNIRSMTDLIAEGLGLDPEPSAGTESSKLENAIAWDANARITAIASESIRLLLDEGVASCTSYLERDACVKPEEAIPVLTFLQKTSDQLQTNQELDALMRALRGEYIDPSPGADIVQNPAILPTGRNTHAINPYLVPSAIAYIRAESVVKALLERHVSEKGSYPRAIGLILWGLDNIKTQGEGVAQALWLLGVKPVRDSMNRATEVEVIPLDELKRPRIDVVMTVSGIFRDLFASTIALLDKAVKSVANLNEPDDMNYIRANIHAGMKEEQCSFDAASLRIFSNAPGNYGTNVNFMVINSKWESKDSLGDLFLARKCFAYGRNSRSEAIEGNEARKAMERALKPVDATYQHLDSFEIGITDVDHYFEYLGGLSRAVEQQTSQRPAIYLSDTLARDVKVRSLEETVRLETRAKTLNPKWYEGMLKHGYRGVAEIESHLANTFGWSATADAVDNWIYTEIAKTFVLDEAMLDRLNRLNPHSLRAIVGRLLEAHDRGFWKVEESMVEKLREVFEMLEEQLEGVA